MTTQELEEITRAGCRERGIDLDAVLDAAAKGELQLDSTIPLIHQLPELFPLSK